MKLSIRTKRHLTHIIDQMLFLLKQCGTGAGGFKPGNVCARGGTGGMVDCKKGADGKFVLSDGRPLPDHLAKTKIPPAWTGVRVNTDPKADLWVKGKDAKGRSQSVYSDAHWAKAAKEKFGRISELRQKEESILKQIRGTKSEESAVLKLIHHTGLRPGGESDTGAKVKAHGATTLEGRHIVPTKDGVRLQFVGKKGVSLDIPVKDKEIAQDLLNRKKKVGESGKIYQTDASKLSNFSQSLDGGGFKTKDFRTLLGTNTALLEIEKHPAPKTEKEYKARVKEVATAVSKQLGNTPTVALQSYIDPSVFSKWRIK